MLDRIDIHVEVPPVCYTELTDETPAEPSSAIRQRVNAARERQQARTIADLDGSETISATHLSEAIQYRTLDRHP